MKTENKRTMQQFENTILKGVTIRLAVVVLITVGGGVFAFSKGYHSIIDEIRDVKAQNELRDVRVDVLRVDVNALKVQVQTLQQQVDELRFSRR